MPRIDSRAKRSREAWASPAFVWINAVTFLVYAVLGAVVGSMPAVRELGASVTPQMISGPWVIAAMVAIMVLLEDLPKPQRKVGHVTLTAESAEALQERRVQVEAVLESTR